jgi:ubiquinone/menaquinone biosynthesis C-methylase UbiE
MDTHTTDTTDNGSGVAPAPNHHCTHRGFSGPSGFLAAVSFLLRRDRAAQLAIELSELHPGERLVDIGCGPGAAVNYARAKGAEVIGVDPAPVMLRVARLRWRAHPEMSWRIGTAESLPVSDNWAQVVWSLATVHHWRDINAGVTEARRVLAPAGRLVALERRIHDTNAAGTASHGWTDEQAESFAEHCRRHGFVDVAVATHAAPSTLLSVVAHLPPSCESSPTS